MFVFNIDHAMRKGQGRIFANMSLGGTRLNPPWACDRIIDAATPRYLGAPGAAGVLQAHFVASTAAGGRPEHSRPLPTRPPSTRSKLEQRIALYDLVEVEVRGDGNCQYRALACALLGDEHEHKCVREGVCRVLDQHRGTFCEHVEGSFDAFLAASQCLGTWGDHVTLQAAADAFHTTIVLFTSFDDDNHGIVSISPMFAGGSGSGVSGAAENTRSDSPVMLSFYAERHYNALFPRASRGAED